MGRINSYPETTAPASDDYLLVDGATGGTKKSNQQTSSQWIHSLQKAQQTP